MELDRSLGSSWGNRPVVQKHLQVRSERVAARAPWGQWQAWLIRPGSLPCQPPLAGLAQNPFGTVIAGAVAHPLGLTLKGQLIGHLGVRGPALRKPEVGGGLSYWVKRGVGAGDVTMWPLPAEHGRVWPWKPWGWSSLLLNRVSDHDDLLVLLLS